MDYLMCSDKKMEANRQNAQKSTGPRTEEGKAKSRRNALKHGLTSEGTVLPPEDTELFQERMQGWTIKERPRDGVDTYLLGCAVLASVHIDRAAKLDFADSARRRRTTNRKWDQRGRKRVHDAAIDIEENPALAVEKLEAFAMGCNWLLAEWDELRECLADHAVWEPEQAAQALRLL